LFSRRGILSAIGSTGIVGLIPSALRAQAGAFDAPPGPIKLVVGFPPGGITDIVTRLVAQGLSQRLARTVVVENQSGAGGNIASAAVARAKPDGLTLVMGATSTHAINLRLYKKLAFAASDFTPIAYVASAPNILLANPKFPPGTIAELISHAKSLPQPLQMAIPGYGTTPHMSGELLKRAAGIDLTFVSYRGGAATTADVIAGNVPLMFDGIITASQQVRAKRLKALGATSPARSPVMPEVPAIAESLAGFDGRGWWGVFSPTGLRSSVAAQLHAAITETVRSPEIASKLTTSGCTIETMTQEQFASLVISETEKWGAIIRDAGIRID
jgi:tripartite-type tricarboxylate transporter receptor subunit TctC